MAKEIPAILKQYDRLAAVSVLIILLASLCYLVFSGLNQRSNVQAYDDKLEQSQPSNAAIAPVDLTEASEAIAHAKAPDKAKLLLKVSSDKAAANLAVPERRLLCIHCGNPIGWSAKVCPFCQAQQPEEDKKIDIASIDTDGDGLPDEWELKYKLDVQNPNDADADLDKDGFTNLEEYLAKTDPTDSKSHPNYDTFIKLQEISGTKLPLRAMTTIELPSKTVDGKTVRSFRVTFVLVNDKSGEISKAYSVKEGEEIAKSGFRYVQYHPTPKRKIEVGKQKQIRYVDVSTVDVERISDGKKVTITLFDKNNSEWPGEPLLEQEATIVVDRPGIEPVKLTAGKTFKVFNETYVLKAVDASKKTVIIENSLTKKEFSVEK